MATNKTPVLVNVKRASEFLGVSERTCYRRAADGLLPAVKLGEDRNSPVRIDMTALVDQISRAGIVDDNGEPWHAEVNRQSEIDEELEHLRAEGIRQAQRNSPEAFLARQRSLAITERVAAKIGSQPPNDAVVAAMIARETAAVDAELKAGTFGRVPADTIRVP